MSFMEKLFGTFSDKELKRIRPIAEKVLALEPAMQKLTDAELQAKTPELKEKLKNGATLDDILPEAFAVCREADWRVLGLKPYPVQVIGGIVLHRACIAEMQTGEGKTLVATMPVYLNALTGEGVHVVTVNDYLAKRDSEWMGKVYRFLGLRVGLVIHDVAPADRKKAYEADVTYGTNNEFGFDYLRDNMVVYKANMVQRGHAYAIVDEVDSILIDEARTPLIISGRGEDSSSLYTQVDQFVRTLRKSVVVELESKEEADDQADGDYVVDEKHKTATLTASGIKKAEEYFKVENLAAAENMTLVHHIEQAIKAHGVMKKDIDYVVKDGEVIIVDEFTGRLMIGRRYNEGLHQAIEAKEGVHIASESKTLATITFQNYFRMYKKLAGMTGTARTEATEFTEIYGLNIVTVPTNKPNIRKDYPDVVYSTVAGKYRAVIDQVMECHAKGQPVLVGTVSVEKSEILAKMLQKRTKDFNVLNAKNHEREAEIVAQAGKKGAITIATNMAGRGTDIMLGGNVTYMAKATLRKELERGIQQKQEDAEASYKAARIAAKAAGEPLPEKPAPIDYTARLDELLTEADGHADTTDEEILAARRRFDELSAEYEPSVKEEAEAVRAAGGLFIIGTERHESRRIDNQLRGRAGRQGDPGASRFFLSLEDDLMRIFGGERVQNMMTTLGIEEDMPIENKLITNTIESAQKKLEASNFAIRKQVLQYDDVMNQQREIIYKQRQQVLNGEDISANLHQMLRQSIDETCQSFLSGETADDWDFAALRRHYMNWLCLPTDFNYTTEQLDHITREEVANTLYERGMHILEAKEKKYGAPMMRELERICLLRNVDSKWMDHIDNMDQLKQGMGLRGYGQHDPVTEYRVEGFQMFDEMVATIREDAVHMLLTIEVRRPEVQPKREQVGQPTGEGAPARPGAKGSAPVRVQKIGRNDPCPCGSGLKWKKCKCKEYHPDL